MKRFTILTLIVVMILINLTGCKEENLTVPEVKEFQSSIDRDDYNFSKSKGTLQEPIKGGELMYLGGDLREQRYEKSLGEMGIEVTKVIRGDASKAFIDKDFVEKKKLKKGKEWIIVEMFVYNFGHEEEVLDFIPDEIAIYNKDGKKLKTRDIGLDSDVRRVAIYEGRPERVTVTSVVNKGDNNILVGVDKLLKNHKVEEGEKLEKEVIEEKEKKDKKKKDKKKKDKKNKNKNIKYLSVDGVEEVSEIDDVVDDLYEEEIMNPEIEEEIEYEGNEEGIENEEEDSVEFEYDGDD